MLQFQILEKMTSYKKHTAKFETHFLTVAWETFIILQYYKLFNLICTLLTLQCTSVQGANNGLAHHRVTTTGH